MVKERFIWLSKQLSGMIINVFDSVLGKIANSSIKHSPNLLRISRNTLWLLLDNFFRTGVAFFISVWLAKYLGPTQFGLYNFVFSIFSILTACATLGLEAIVIRKLITNPAQRENILGTAFYLKLVAGLTCLVLGAYLILLLKQGDIYVLGLSVILLSGLLFLPFDVIDYHFQSVMSFKYSVIARLSAFSMAAGIRILLILIHAPLISFIAVSLLEISLTAICFIVVYYVKKKHMFHLSFSFPIAKSLLGSSIFIYLTGIFGILYMRSEQIIIAGLLGNRELGLYSVAVRLSEIWYFIPMMISSVVLPTAVELRENNKHVYNLAIKRLYSVMVLFGLTVTMFGVFFSKQIVVGIFGQEYIQASSIFSVRICNAVFFCIGTIFWIWAIVEGFERFFVYRASIACIVNIFLNFILIPHYANLGAALAMVISYSIAEISFLFFKPTRQYLLGLFFPSPEGVKPA